MPEEPGSPGALLVVEDEPAHAEAIGRALTGRRVRYAASLAEARRCIEAWRPSLVLADMHLGDGLALDLLPRSGEPAPFALVVMTARGDEQAAVESIRAGALDYVVKSPEAFASLPRALDRALRQWQSLEERRRTEQELRDSEERFRVLFAAAPDAMVIHDLEGVVLDGNLAAEQLVGMPRREVVGKNLFSLGIFSPSDHDVAADRLAVEREGQGTGPDELTVRRPDGTSVDVEVRTVPLQLQGRTVILAIVRDISTRKQAARTRRRLEEQLQQAMKMDAIGRLAGGVAHDFNNLLTAISSYTELLLAEVRPSDPMRADLLEIKRAGERAASLTAQLLAFGRKQVIAPVVVDLNQLLSSSTRMIQRLIGEHVQLGFTAGPGLGNVRVDPGQMDQVLINLAINARDAMPDGGALAFETAQVEVDEALRAVSLDARPGPHVKLTVRDSGAGMDPETLARVFEPFFTTKQPGQGTGLGLSILYGIIKQNGGFILVASQPGAGTAFEIFLPCTSELPAPLRAARPELPAGHGEILLLVEDDDSVLRVTERFLSAQGYRVLATDRPTSAGELAARAGGTVALLLTDVVMPVRNGRQVWDELRARQPGLPALFMSGHTDDIIARQGLLEPGMRFLQKPFSLEDLARKVREALDETR